MYGLQKERLPLVELMKHVDSTLEWECWEDNDDWFVITPINLSSVITWCRNHETLHFFH